MGKKMKRQKTTAAELPEEVLHREILTRLPIKSAVRFKSVSKSWLSLFSDPQFVTQHYNYNAPQNPNTHDCLVADKGNKLVILSRHRETKLLPIDNTCFLIGSINGVNCLRRGVKFSLWNPAIHQSKEFNLPAEGAGLLSYNIGLGFDDVNNDFKVVVLLTDFKCSLVYCSGLDSWSDVVIPDDLFVNEEFEKFTPPFIVKGCPYWTFSTYTYVYANGDVERSYVKEASLSVLKFDVETNDFSLSPTFRWDMDDYGGLEVGGGPYEFCHQFVDMKDCLTLIVHDRNSSFCELEIYTLDGEEGCSGWSMKYSIGPLDFSTRGWYVSLSQGFQYDGEVLFQDHGMFSSIDPKTEEIKRLVGTTSTEYEISCFRYTPTLFYIQGMKSVYLTTQTRTPGCIRTPRRLISSLRD